ncbi:UNVERIFIED_CONTAM: putative mitochondrial protein [Sesamum radiatum]|uniref:Mitochondrial protein n=1 Tax=Sesamum radiatum TaxID=300843 RepID=A0AAW2LBZ9_SESRA
MLAKQCWRVFTNPHSLLGRLLKARYFPHSSFLDAPLSSRPSLTWRSLLSARPLMLAGIRWRGGSSRSIKVWASPWIPRSSSFRPITPVATNDPNLLVSALIDHELGTWKHDRLRDLFLPVDVEAILKIPLGRTSQPDFAVWHYSADGRFSVRSAYHLVWSMRQVGASPSAPRSWTFLWTAKVPPKVGLWAMLSLGVVRLARSASPEVAEAVAAREAACLAIRFGWRYVIIEGDCEPLVLKLQSSSFDFSCTSPIVHDIKSLVSNLSCGFSLVRRTGNRVAHSIARAAGAFTVGSWNPPRSL